PDSSGAVTRTDGPAIGDAVSMAGTVAGVARNPPDDSLQALDAAVPLAGQAGLELPQWVQGATQAAGLVQSLAKGSLGERVPDLPGIAGVGAGATPGFNP